MNNIKLALQHYPLTLAISVVTVLCFIIQFLTSRLLGQDLAFQFLHFPMFGAPDFLNHTNDLSQPWRLLTPVFLHFGLLHIAFNLVFWFLLGRLVECRQGNLRLLGLFVVASLVPNIAQFMLTGPNFGGLSGVVYALFGYVWAYGHLNKASGLYVPVSLMLQIIAWMVVGITGILDSIVGPMANAAHIGGFLVGLFLAVPFAYLDR